MATILSTIGRIANEFSAARMRYRTECALYALPVEVQKDIGWPEVRCPTSLFDRAGDRPRPK